ncbi:MAG: cation transporter [Cytophagales bacterium]|jgi:copper chaperone|nr:cation transporter [Cytophagales bacterium]
MNTFKFKTNIKCGGCIATVTPHLNQLTGIENWSVDTSDPDKVLSVQADTATVDEIRKTVEKAGFKAEAI